MGSLLMSGLSREAEADAIPTKGDRPLQAGVGLERGLGKSGETLTKTPDERVLFGPGFRL